MLPAIFKHFPIFFVLALLVTYGRASATELIDAPLPVSVAVGAKSFAQFAKLAISPDGTLVAYSVQVGTRIRSPWLGVASPFTPSGVPGGTQGGDLLVTDIRQRHTDVVSGGVGTSWNPVWSKSGRYLAYLSDRGGAVHLWIWDRISRHRRQVSPAIVHSQGFVPVLWAANDTKLLAPILAADMSLSDANAYFSAYLTGPVGRKSVSHSTIHVYSFDPKSPTSAVDLAHLNGYAGASNGDPNDYSLIDVKSGHVTRLLHHVSPQGVSVSDDGHFVTLMTLSGAAGDAHDQDLYDLSTVSLADGHTIFSRNRVPMASDWVPSWQPGHDAFMYTIGARSIADATKLDPDLGESYLVTVPDGHIRKITNGPHPPFGLYRQKFAWSADGSRLVYIFENHVWAIDVAAGTAREAATLPVDVQNLVLAPGDRLPADGTKITILTHDSATQQDGFREVDLSSGKLITMLNVDQAIGGYEKWLMGVTADGSKLIYLAENAMHPPDLWMTPTARIGPIQLTHLNLPLERYRFGTTKLVNFSMPDGQTFSGALLLPSEYVAGRRYPTIIYQYPGEKKARNLNVFGASDGFGNFQLYATRGYAVFLPDMSWKSLKGADLTNGVAIQWINAMLDKLVAIGVSDEAKFGIEGGSFGGYSTLAIITQTNRFHAAISDSGFSNMFSKYGEFTPNDDAFYTGETESQAGGTPWTAFDSFVSMSPVFKFDRVTTPVFLVQGSGAIWLQQKEADESYVALRRLNKEVTYAVYGGDGHTRGSFIYPHALDYWTRAIDWYDRHLKTPE